MAPVGAVLAIVGIVAGMAVLFCYADGLKLFAPKSTDRMAGAAQHFCHEKCRWADGNCPLVEVRLETAECPLWRFVQARLSTDLRVDPFRPLGPGTVARAA